MATRELQKAEGSLSLRSVGPSLTVNDIQKSLEWYRDVLGFAVGERWEEGGKLFGVELKAGPAMFVLNQDDWKKGRDRQKGEGFRLYCETDQDVDQLAARIKERGGRLDQEPQDMEGMRGFTLADPDGFKITIVKNR
jgi:catechol 2,3-dioxygenase-like lactoylglutathione lyase family enzyme